MAQYWLFAAGIHGLVDAIFFHVFETVILAVRFVFQK